MINAAIQSADRTAPVDERDLWMPPRGMRRYQLAKLTGVAVVVAIFGGWLLIQWSNPAMRVLCIALLVVTLLVAAVSIIDDLTRQQRGQVAMGDNAFEIKCAGEVRRVCFGDIAYAVWREDNIEQAGLWFFDADDRVLAHLDVDVLGDQGEARDFLRWARGRGDLAFDVRWPST